MHSAHPQELAHLRTACRPVLEEVGPLERELHTACVVCGKGPSAVLARRDRHGFSVRTALCMHCGVVYQMDGFSPDSWEMYRGSGARERLAHASGAEQEGATAVVVDGVPDELPARDLRAGFRLLSRRLPEGAVVECELPDLLACCRRSGPAEAVASIERCFWVLEETAPRVFACLGFEVLSADTSRDPRVRYRLRKNSGLTTKWESGDYTLQAILREFREIDAEWRAQGRVPRDRVDYLRHKAYRMKRILVRTLHIPL